MTELYHFRSFISHALASRVSQAIDFGLPGQKGLGVEVVSMRGQIHPGATTATPATQLVPQMYQLLSPDPGTPDEPEVQAGDADFADINVEDVFFQELHPSFMDDTVTAVTNVSAGILTPDGNWFKPKEKLGFDLIFVQNPRHLVSVEAITVYTTILFMIEGWYRYIELSTRKIIDIRASRL